MKILELKPKQERKETCSYCDTVYLIEESDVTAKIDFFGRRVNINCNDLLGEWKCPGCGAVAGAWLYKLPWSWRDAIIARSPGINTEHERLRQAELNREGRLNEYESKFDRLLRCFTFRK